MALVVAFILDVIVGIDAFNMDFIKTDGTIASYTPIWYLRPAF
jgi:hypothetical protein